MMELSLKTLCYGIAVFEITISIVGIGGSGFMFYLILNQTSSGDDIANFYGLVAELALFTIISLVNLILSIILFLGVRQGSTTKCWVWLLPKQIFVVICFVGFFVIAGGSFLYAIIALLGLLSQIMFVYSVDKFVTQVDYEERVSLRSKF